MLCYDIKIVFHFNAIVKIPFYLLWVRNIKLHLFIKQIINFSVEETLFIWTMSQILFFVSRPYKEDYQVSRISHKGCQGHLPSPLKKFSSVSTLKIFRVVSSNELHAKIARPLSAVRIFAWRKENCLPNHLLAFWRQPHVRNLMFQFRLLKCFPQRRKFAKNAQYKSWDSSGVRGQRHEGKRAFPITY